MKEDYDNGTLILEQFYIVFFLLSTHTELMYNMYILAVYRRTGSQLLFYVLHVGDNIASSFAHRHGAFLIDLYINICTLYTKFNVKIHDWHAMVHITW